MRRGRTRQGREVVLNRLVEVEGGAEGYVLDRHGFAVKVFIPD